MTTRTRDTSRPSGFRAEVGSGYGAFNGVVIPSGLVLPPGAAENTEVTSNHQGMPLSVLGGWTGTYGRFRPTFDLSYLKMINMKYEDTDRQASAGYSRWELNLRADYWLGRNVAGSALLVTRRNFYKNRLESHVLDGVMPGLGLKGRYGRWETGLAGYVSVYSKYGFNKGRGLANRSLGATESSVYGYEWDGAYRTSRDGRLTFGLQQETAKVTVDDVGEYVSYGFNVSPTVPRQRSYQLTTTILSFGFLKLL